MRTLWWYKLLEKSTGISLVQPSTFSTAHCKQGPAPSVEWMDSMNFGSIYKFAVGPNAKDNLAHTSKTHIHSLIQASRQKKKEKRKGPIHPPTIAPNTTLKEGLKGRKQTAPSGVALVFGQMSTSTPPPPSRLYY